MATTHSSPSASRFFSTAGVTSYTVLVTPPLVDSFFVNVCPSNTGGSFFIFVGLVREVCRYVPPVRSIVRVFSRFSGWIYRARLAGSFRSTCVNPSQPRRMPITSYPISDPRYTTDLITEFKPGTSPPPVRMPIRFPDMMAPQKISGMNHSLYRKQNQHRCWERCGACQPNHCGNQRRTVHLDDDAPPGAVVLFRRVIPRRNRFSGEKSAC